MLMKQYHTTVVCNDNRIVTFLKLPFSCEILEAWTRELHGDPEEQVQGQEENIETWKNKFMAA